MTNMMRVLPGEKGMLGTEAAGFETAQIRFFDFGPEEMITVFHTSVLWLTSFNWQLVE